MKIVFPPPVQPAASSRPASVDKAVAAVERSVPVAAGEPQPHDDADIVRAAEAALKAGSDFDSRVSEIKKAVQSGRIRFDADVLAASILRHHGKQD